ncbi:MAG: gfo/Idh/MocA family oxidoreductase, partial [Planctomycetaceae bacterium]
MNRPISRRAFLEQTTAASLISAGLYVGGSPARASQSANEKLNIAAVGVANKGGHNIDELAGQNFVALCDVDENYLTQWGEKHPQATRYRDYRKMLEKEAKNIDAVVVSTADHTHAPAASVALDLGKHVYCEKPLAHTVAEARALSKLAARRKVATQMGTQIHATDNYRRVVEIIQGGVLGEIHAVYNWCNKGWSDGRFHCGSVP